MGMPKRLDILTVFPSGLGWMALIGSGRVLKWLGFGHPSAAAAARAVPPDLAQTARPGTWNPTLVHRLQAYAQGSPDDFRDVRTDPGPQTAFRRRVIACCRRIPFGTTLSYGQVAARAGSKHAARAVGNCMAANRIPLVIPCHRVVAAGGGLGGYSARGGIATKRRLLELEAGKVMLLGGRRLFRCGGR